MKTPKFPKFPNQINFEKKATLNTSKFFQLFLGLWPSLNKCAGLFIKNEQPINTCIFIVQNFYQSY